jgi:hypothetical protein
VKHGGDLKRLLTTNRMRDVVAKYEGRALLNTREGKAQNATQDKEKNHQNDNCTFWGARRLSLSWTRKSIFTTRRENPALEKEETS